jgi:uridine phosphorylase
MTTQKHLPISGLPVGEVPAAALVCGDPARATRIAEYLDEATLLSEQREYRCYRGSFAGTPIAVCSHGVGAPGAAPLFEELIIAGAKRLIRVGTCGALQPDIGDGTLIVATAAVQHTGYGRETVPPGYPAVADLDLTLALRRALPDEHPSRSGVVLTRDNFYAGVDTPHTPHYATLSQANVLAVEMEAAALFIVGSLRGAAAGAILVVDGNVVAEGESVEAYDPHRDVVRAGTDAAIQVALAAMVSQATAAPEEDDDSS